LNLLGLAQRNVRGNRFRSAVVFLCVLGLAGFFLSTTLIIRGAETSLRRGLDRLGADLLVVPSGAEAVVESALLMGQPTSVWMPGELVDRIKSLPGIAAVSPQLYLTSGDVLVVGFDPASDFTIQPWLRQESKSLGKGEVILGAGVNSTTGNFNIAGQSLVIKGRLDGTGGALDMAVFVNLDTAAEMRKVVPSDGTAPTPAGSYSAVLVKVKPGIDISKMALYMVQEIMGISPIQSPQMFAWFRDQMNGLLWGFITILSIIWVLAAVAIGLVFSMVTNERRRQIAVLRALGATRAFIFRSLLAEALILGTAAAIIGIVLAAAGVYLFSGQVSSTIGIPFLFPSLSSLASLLAVSLAMALVTVALAAFVPVFRVSRLEPAIAMRE